MKVLAFDQSSRCSGYAFFENGEYVESGVIDMSKSKLETDERSFEMAKELWKVMRKYKPDYLVIEQVQNQSNIKTVVILARLAGMLIGYAKAHNIDVYVVEPSKWRRVLDFHQGAKVKRQELKQQSINFIQENLGKKLKEDESEAACIGFAAHRLYDFEHC